MDQGYVRLWRKSLRSPIWQNANMWRLWEWCLMKASWQERDAIVGFQKVHLMPGQFIFGRKIASKETGLSERTIRTSLLHLQNYQNLTIKPTNKYSIITITNWDIYQSEEDSIDQQSDHHPTSKRPASDHRQESKECKEGKKITPLTPLKRGEVELPPWMPSEIWNSYREHRKILKSPMTMRAEQLALSKLESWKGNGFDPVAIVNQSIERGWKGLFELRSDNGQSGFKTSETADDWAVRKERELAAQRIN